VRSVDVASGVVVCIVTAGDRLVRVVEGLDDISLTLAHEADIAAYEATRPSWKPATLG
jgi:3-isopropylmalate/(R)-2-methylmalate dehydratase small subunit